MTAPTPNRNPYQNPEAPYYGPRSTPYPVALGNLGMNAAERTSLGKEVRQRALNELGEELNHIAHDPSGSDPALYFSPDNLEVLEEARILADSRGWPDAKPMHLEDKSFRVLPRRKRDTTVRDAEGNPVSGYVVGKLGVSGYAQLVFFCSDGLLRSMRSEELHHSGFRGFGKLPDPDTLCPALDPGRVFGIDITIGMRTKNLEQIIQKESGVMF